MERFSASESESSGDYEPGDVTAFHVPSIAMAGRPLELSVEMADPQGTAVSGVYFQFRQADGGPGPGKWATPGPNGWSLDWEPAAAGRYTIFAQPLLGSLLGSPVTRPVRVTEDTAIMDNADSGYHKEGPAWTLRRDNDATSEAYADLYHAMDAGEAGHAEWQFADLDPDVYGVYTTHVAVPEQAEARVSVYDGEPSESPAKTPWNSPPTARIERPPTCISGE
ncbi:MAG: hypothetical protein R6U98_24425 [Pirellulaceae bacterium]